MLVYISGPYTAHSHQQIGANIASAREVAIKIWESGHVALCPHLNTAHFEVDCEASYEQFMAGDLLMLTKCDAIQMIDGWPKSSGAKLELQYAIALGLQVFYWPDMPEMQG